MKNKIKLSIITPRGIHYEGDVELATFKIYGGDIGIMANRIPMSSPIRTSKISVVLDDNQRRIGVLSRGMLLADSNEAVLIVEDALWIDEQEKSILDGKLSKLEEKILKEESEFIREQMEDEKKFLEIAIENL